MVQDLAQRAQVPTPRLYTDPVGSQPNAFATGRNPRHAAIAVTEGLLRDLPPDQSQGGVLAHEFGHITNRDILVSSIAATVAGAIAVIADVLQFSLFFGGDNEDRGPLGWIGLLGTIVVAPIAAVLLQLAVSRQREYLADATGAELLGRAAPLADALERLDRASQALPMAVNPAVASLYAVNPLSRQGAAALFLTHPPIAERVRRLRALDGDQTSDSLPSVSPMLELEPVFQLLSDAPLAYLVLFLVAAGDAIIPLFPSESAVILAGVLSAAESSLVLGWIVAAAAAGAFAGDITSYALGRSGRRLVCPWIRGGRREATVLWARTALDRRGGVISSSPASSPAVGRRRRSRRG